MNRRLLLVPLLTCVFGCGSSPAPPVPEATTGYKDDMSFDTGAFQIQPGDNFNCFYTTAITQHEINLIGAMGHQDLGGHHITVYYVDIPRTPQHHTCTDAEMVSWHLVSGADVMNGGEPVISYPPGLAVKLPAGKQIAIQSHYINTTGQTQTVDDQVTLQTTATSDVQVYGNFFISDYEGFQIPAAASATSTTYCDIKQDLSLVLFVGHEHELGKQFTLDRVDSQGKTMETIYSQGWEPTYASHPPVLRGTLDAPIKFAAGSRLRQTCVWDNTTPQSVIFPREMCVGFGVYFPDTGSEIDCGLAPASAK